MTPVLAFGLLALALLALVLVVVLRPLLRRAAAAAPVIGEQRSNLELLREQLVEIDAERDAGVLPAADHAAARADLERRVLEESAGAGAAPAAERRASPAAALALAVALPLLAVLLYARLGTPAALDPRSRVAAAAPVSPEQVQAMLEALAQRMEAEPGDPEGWAILGRSYAALQRLPEARRALARAAALRPGDAQLLADYADVIGALQGQSLAGEPTQLLARALQLEPDNLKALVLAGSAAFERGEPLLAVEHWQRARTQVPPGSEYAAGLDASIAEARAAAASPAVGAAGGVAGTAAGAASAAGVTVRGRVQLAPALAAEVRPDDTVFIYARPAEGSRMPLAIQRHRAAELPLDFALDDSAAMSPAARLSQQTGAVVVVARVSRSGQAAPQTGDLLGQSAPFVAGSAAPLQITIDQRQR